MERKIEIWRRIEVFEYPTETQWKKALSLLKRSYRGSEVLKVRGIKTKSQDKFLTGIEKQVFHNNELPKLTREERLKRFKATQSLSKTNNGKL